MIEKILERLEAKKKEYLEAFRTHGDNERYGIACGFGDSIKIVQEVAKEYGKDTNVRSNADHIRSMSDEELAEFLCGVFDEDECDGKYICGVTIPNYDEDRIAEWLKSEAKE